MAVSFDGVVFMIIRHFYRTAISCVLRKVNQTNCEINVYTVLCSHARYVLIGLQHCWPIN